MDVKLGLFCLLIGMLGLFQQIDCASVFPQSRKVQFRDTDQRTLVRNKRNVSYVDFDEGDLSDLNSVQLTDAVTETPKWKQDLLNGKYYGSESYMQRTLYTNNKKPAICYDNETVLSNGQRLSYFVCPMENQTDRMLYCCGESLAQKCCNKEEHDAESVENTDEEIITEDIVTGIGIAAAFVVSLTFCLFLYCCCCQRRHEIHDGVKLMWVRRSFGKELNRLEQPAIQDHMTVVNSITGLREDKKPSRHGSRQGSRHGSRQASRSNSLWSLRSRQGSFKTGGSKNPSVGPTPSISRRESNDHHEHLSKRNSSNTGQGSNRNPSLELPNVLITVTTPSDEHGPTSPLLKNAQHPDGEQES